MKRTISTLLLVLLCLTPITTRYWIQETYGAECEDSCSDPVQLARMSPAILGAGSGVAGTNFCDGYSGLFCDDFEGASTCGDDADSEANCRNASAWSLIGSDAGGTITNQKTTAIAGSYSKYIDANSHSTYSFGTQISFSANSEVWGFAIAKIDDLDASGNSLSLFVVAENGGDAYCSVGINVEAGMKWSANANGALSKSDSGPSQGTPYCIWIHYKNNTATTGCQVFVTEYSAGTCVKSETAVAQTATGNYGNVDLARFRARDQVSFADFDLVWFDNVKIKATPIGDNGE